MRTKVAALAIAMLAGVAAARADELVVASKTFTESVILGEIITGLLAHQRIEARHHRQLGGTRVLWNALVAGEIDVYPEYTGTISNEILAGELVPGGDIAAALARHGVRMTAPLGFNNTYAIALAEQRATALGLDTISDLIGHPELALGFSSEFMDRADGWSALRARYRLPHEDVTGLDHDLAYRGLESGTLDVMDVYATDAEIAYYGLRVLDDDLGHFPSYDAVILYRNDLDSRAAVALRPLAGAIDAAAMRALNARVKLDRASEARVAADFLAKAFEIDMEVVEESWLARLARNTLAHLALVAVSLGAAIVVAIPLGVAAARSRALGQVILAVAGVLQTIPSLALFVFMIPLLGIGGPPAMVALFLYSLLPIVRNTHAGLTGIAPELLESADALGLPRRARLRHIELPLAAPSILAGIKTAAVINVGTATLAALIGAGGYGQPIITGIRLDDIPLILEGAIPAALLALAVQGAFDLAERAVVPAGLRLRPGV